MALKTSPNLTSHSHAKNNTNQSNWKQQRPCRPPQQSQQPQYSVKRKKPQQQHLSQLPPRNSYPITTCYQLKPIQHYRRETRIVLIKIMMVTKIKDFC